MDQASAAPHIAQAQVDLRQGNWRRALARFRWLLLAGAPNAQYEIAYQNTIRTITNENPLRFSAGAALLPSTNLSNGSSQSTFVTDFGVFQIDSAKDRKSGMGLHLNGAATYSLATDRGRSWSLTASAATNLYREKELQLGQLNLSASHEWLSNGRHSRLSFGLSKAVYRDLPDRKSPNYSARSLSFSHNQRLSAKTWLALQANLQDLRYPKRSHNNGQHYSLYLTPSYQMGPNTTLSLKAGLQSVQIKAKHLSYGGQSLGLFFDRRETNGLRWGVGLETHWRHYDSRFPGLQIRRKDQVQDVILSASHARIQFKGMTPNLRCTFRDHHSNVALYKYDTVDCAVSLNYQF